MLFLPQNGFWGISHLKYLSAADAALSFMSALLVAFLFAFFAGKRSHDVFPKFRNAGLVVMVLLTTSCFYLFRAQNAFLGDGAMLLSYLKNGDLNYPSNMADYFVHALIYNIFLRARDFSPESSYLAVGMVCGAIYQIAALRYLKIFNAENPKALYLYALLLVNGCVVYFFGYVESYTILFVFVQLYLLSSIHSISNDRNIIVPLLLFLAAFIFHQISLLLVPSVFYLLYHRLKRQIAFKEKAGYFLLLAVLTGIIFYLALGPAGSGLSRYRAMLSERGLLDLSLFLNIYKGHYSVVSPRHFLDILNLFLLYSPISLVVPFYWVCRKDFFKDPVRRFVFIAASFMALFFFFMKPDLGMYRDWDLFSMPVAVFSILAVYGMKEYFDRASSLAKSLLVFVVVFHAMNWVLLNHSKEASLKRFTGFVETMKTVVDDNVLAHDYEQLADYCSRKHDYQGELAYRIRIDSLLENPRNINNLAICYFQMEDYRNAIVALKRYLKIRPETPETYLQLALSYYALGDYENAVALFERCKKLHAIDPAVLSEYGMALYRTGRFAGAVSVLKDALTLEPSNKDFYNAIGSALAMNNQHDEASAFFKTAVALDPGNALAWSNLARSFEELRDYPKADSCYQEALKRGCPPDSAFEMKMKMARSFKPKRPVIP